MWKYLHVSGETGDDVMRELPKIATGRSNESHSGGL